MSVAVSVIMPAYNTGEYIEQALRSILDQTLTDLEVILVDDGSTDDTARIVKSIAAADSRVKYHHQSNHGLAATRNIALQYATGEFIYFMDSDDDLDSECLKACCDKCHAEELDFVAFDADIFGIESCFNDGYYRRMNRIEDRVYSGCELMSALLDNDGYRASVCLNFIRRSYLESINLRFIDIRKHEDEYFTSMMYLCASRAGVINREFFHRRMRNNSIMTTALSWANMECYFISARKTIDYIADVDRLGAEGIERASVARRFLGNMLDAAVWKAHVLPYGQRLRVFFTVMREFGRYVKCRTLAVILFKIR